MLRQGLIGLWTAGFLIASFSSFLIAQETTSPVGTDNEPVQNLPETEETSAPSPVEALPLPGLEGTTPVPVAGEQEMLPPVEATAPSPAVMKFTLRPKWQIVSLTSPSYKAEEYRILPDGFYLDLLSMSLQQEQQEVNVSANHLFLTEEEGQEAVMENGTAILEWNRYGFSDLRIQYQKQLHLYADSLSGSLTRFSAPREQSRLHFRMTPGDQLSLQINLSVEKRRGTRPFPTENVFLGTDTAVIEIAEPIDYTTTALSVGAEYLNGPMAIQLENQFQIFNNNRTTSASWNNPYRAVDGAAKLSDDYWVQTLSLRPSFRFSDHWSWMNSISYAQVTSRIHLIPVSTSQSIEDLPFSFVEPDVRNLILSSSLTGQPWRDLTLKFRYRFNDYQNDTFIVTPFPDYVKLEEDVQYPVMPLYSSHRVQNIETTGTYRLTSWGSLQGGIQMEQTDREQREVSGFRESRYFVKGRAAFHRLQGEGGYTRAQGRPSGYDATWYKTVYDPDPANSETQHRLLRAFDLAYYTSDEFHAGVTYQPIDNITTGVSYKNRHKEYPDTLIGRTASEDQTLSADLQYTPRQTVVSFVQYIYQKSDISGRYTWSYEATPVPSCDPANPTADPNDLNCSQDPGYIAFRFPRSQVLSDQTDTTVVGIQYYPVSGLEITGSYSLVQSSDSSTRLPTVTSRFDDFSVEIRYRFNRSQKATVTDFLIELDYHYERFEQNDFALSNFPDPGTSTADLFLGIRDPDYTAHVIAVSCTFSF